MKKILWLSSWYPSRLNPFNGDFIQRHALAVSLYTDITLIYLVKDDNGIYTNNILAEESVRGGLREVIVYYKPFSTGIAIIDKLLSSVRYLWVFRKEIDKHIRKNGRPDLIHVQVPMKAGILANWYKKKLNIPFIVTEHWCAYNGLNPQGFFKQDLAFRKLTGKIFRAADLVTMVCESNQTELLNLFSIKKSVVVANVADSRLFHFNNHDASLPFIFVHVSSLTHQKNPEGILTAFAALKNYSANWRCIMVGPTTSSLTGQAKELGLEEWIEWTGEISYESVAFNLQKAHCMVMFSRYENAPCSIIEALSTGIPVIATAVGGIPEMINSSNGLLVDSENTGQLALAMEQMIRNYQEYQRTGIAETAKAAFSYEVVGAQITAIYGDMLSATVK